jgi:hypothetical protein
MGFSICILDLYVRFAISDVPYSEISSGWLWYSSGIAGNIVQFACLIHVLVGAKLIKQN